VVTPIRLYPLHCTLYCCTLTRRQSTAPVALSSAFISDFFFKVLQCTLHWLQLSQHFSLAISFRNQQFLSKFSFLLEVSKELPQRSTLNPFFVALSFLVVRLHSLTLFALVFFCVCHIFVSSPNLLPYSGFHFLFLMGQEPSKPLDFANFL
jgi:hypothetical protein